MARGYTYVPRRAVTVVVTAAGVAVLLCSVGVLSACSSSSADKTAPDRATASSATTGAAAKAAADKAAAEQSAAVKAAAKKYVANQKAMELAASRSHPVAKAAAACGVPLGYVYA